jgi:hypothetical protein
VKRLLALAVTGMLIVAPLAQGCAGGASIAVQNHARGPSDTGGLSRPSEGSGEPTTTRPSGGASIPWWWESSDDRSGRPTASELGEAFGAPWYVRWLGQDSRGVWWAAIFPGISHFRGVGGVYAYPAFRDSSGKWEKLRPGTRSGEIRVDKRDAVPKDVVSAMRRAGIDVREVK